MTEIQEKGSNALVDQVKNSFKLHFEKQLNNVLRELSQKELDLRDNVEKHQQLGLALYAAQKEAVKWENKVQKVQEELEKKNKDRKTAENELSLSEEKQLKVLDVWNKSRQRESDAQLELENISSQLLEVSEAEAKLFSESKIKKKEASGTTKEGNAIKLQLYRNNLIIDGLKSEIETLQEKIESCQQQWCNQDQRIQEVKQLVSNAKSEIEALRSDKQVLLQQWKRSLTVLAQRNDAQSKIQDLLRSTETEVCELETELKTERKCLQDQLKQNEKTCDTLSQLEQEVLSLGRKVETALQEKESNDQQMQLLELALEETQAQVERMKKQKHRYEEDMSSADRKIANLRQKVQALNDEHNIKLSEESMSTALARKLLREFHKLQKMTKKMEREMYELQSSFLELSLEETIYMSQVSTYEDILRGSNEELNKQDQQLAKLESLLDKCLSDISNRQAKIWNYQKRLNSAVPTSESKELDPSEKRELALKERISWLEQESDKLEKQNLSKQSELMSLKKDMSSGLQEAENIQSDIGLLRDRILRLNSKLNQEEKRGVFLKQNHEHLQRAREELSAVFQSRKEELAAAKENNQIYSDAALQKIKESEAETTDMEKHLESIREDLLRVKESIRVTGEETQECEDKLSELDITKKTFQRVFFTDEMKELRNKINQKRAKCSQLQNNKQQLALQVEKGLAIRDNLLVKANLQEQKLKGRNNQHQGFFLSGLNSINRKIKAVERDMKACDEINAKLEDKRKDLEEKLQSETISHQNADPTAIVDSNKDLQRNQTRNTFLLSLKQEKAKFFVTLADDYLKGRSEAYVEENIKKLRDSIEQISSDCQRFCTDHDTVTTVVEKITALRDCAQML